MCAFVSLYVCVRERDTYRDGTRSGTARHLCAGGRMAGCARAQENRSMKRKRDIERERERERLIQRRVETREPRRLVSFLPSTLRRRAGVDEKRGSC